MPEPRTVNRFGWLPPPPDGRDQRYRVRALRSQLQKVQQT